MLPLQVLPEASQRRTDDKGTHETSTLGACDVCQVWGLEVGCDGFKTSPGCLWIPLWGGRLQAATQKFSRCKEPPEEMLSVRHLFLLSLFT